VPAERINLHHRRPRHHLGPHPLAAVIDNHLHFDNPLGSRPGA
jgi:hypothetical protein